ncbi:MAG: DNA translocase FtsK 4TM domain-containing protein, partial [Polaromonas sp.]
MTYSLDTLNSRNSPATGAPAGIKRFAREVGLILGLVGLVLWLAALLSYSPQDAAWSTSGNPEVSSGTLVAAKNLGGHLGAWVADASYFLLGYSVWWALAAGCRAWLLSVTRGLRGEALAPNASRLAGRIRFWLGLLLLLAASAALEWSRLYRFEFSLPGHAGGVIGYVLGNLGVKWLGFAGSGLVFIALGVIAVASVFNFSWALVALSLGARLDSFVTSRREKRELAADLAVGKKAAREREETLTDERIEIEGHHSLPVLIKPSLAELPKSERAVKVRPQAPTVLSAAVMHTASGASAPLLPSDSRLPQVSLLDVALLRQESVASETLEMTSRLIEKKLKDFGVEVRVVAAAPGPVITRYEIEPATGVKGSQVVTLAKDLARALSLVSIRVVETIPGKNYMALELPNAKRQSIKLSEILGSKAYNDATSMLTIGLGKDIAGHAVVADLAKMPHCLVAGTTGSGKSVGINAMILSLLYKADPRDVRLLLIDPKMLEMSAYEGIPHLLCPVVTDMRQAAYGLNWCVAEMEKRYKLMSKLGVRNLAGYNVKLDEAKVRGEFIYNPFSLTPEQPEPLDRLPYIVVVIDELADLMMVVGKKIEELIARLAQKARAAGIHLVLATQRPSVDVITGLIKANIPT